VALTAHPRLESCTWSVTMIARQRGAVSTRDRSVWVHRGALFALVYRSGHSIVLFSCDASHALLTTQAKEENLPLGLFAVRAGAVMGVLPRSG
jgi:hypothetical protein